MKGKIFTTALALAALALVLVLGLLAGRTVVSVSRISMSLKQLNLLAGLHHHSSLNLSKAASSTIE